VLVSGSPSASSRTYSSTSLVLQPQHSTSVIIYQPPTYNFSSLPPAPPSPLIRPPPRLPPHIPTTSISALSAAPDSPPSTPQPSRLRHRKYSDPASSSPAPPRTHALFANYTTSATTATAAIMHRSSSISSISSNASEEETMQIFVKDISGLNSEFYFF
jgi:hypothetical protein